MLCWELAQLLFLQVYVCACPWLKVNLRSNYKCFALCSELSVRQLSPEIMFQFSLTYAIYWPYNKLGMPLQIQSAFSASCGPHSTHSRRHGHHRVEKLNTPWRESASEPYRPSDRPLSAKLVPTFADRRYLVLRVTEPYGRILGFLDWSRYFFFQVAPQLYSRGWVDPVPDPLILRKSWPWPWRRVSLFQYMCLSREIGVFTAGPKSP
jgi:hypothetical protein